MKKATHTYVLTSESGCEIHAVLLLPEELADANAIRDITSLAQMRGQDIVDVIPHSCESVGELLNCIRECTPDEDDDGPAPCEHEPDWGYVQSTTEDVDAVEIRCRLCGEFGTAAVRPSEINW